MPRSSPPTCQRQPKIDQLSASNPTPRTGPYSVAVDTTQSPSKTQLHQAFAHRRVNQVNTRPRVLLRNTGGSARCSPASSATCSSSPKRPRRPNTSRVGQSGPAATRGTRSDVVTTIASTEPDTGTRAAHTRLPVPDGRSALGCHYRSPSRCVELLGHAASEPTRVARPVAGRPASGSRSFIRSLRSRLPCISRTV
jgi:hypothetical protein